MKKSGAGRCLFLNFPFPGEPGSAVARALAADLAALAGIEPVVRFDADVDVPPLDFGLFRDGDALYVGMVMRGAGGRVSEEKPQDLRIELPARRHYYDSRAGKYLGEGREVRDRVTPSIAKVYAGLPGRITKVDAVMEKKGYRRGQTAMARISVTAEPAVSWRQVLRIRVARPDGKEETAYARTVLMEQGRVSLDLPLALDAPAGRWELSVRDAATGAHGQCLFEVQE
jgi:hypothetical protein